MTAIDLGYRLRKWQRECHLNRKRFTVLALARLILVDLHRKQGGTH